MKPDDILNMMKDGSIVKYYSYRKKRKWVLYYPDNTCLVIQGSLIYPLVKRGDVISRTWFGGSMGDVIYRIKS